MPEHRLSRRSFGAAAAAAVPRFAGAAPAPIRRERDSRTGREVWQVTEGGAISHSCYFEAQPFTRDDRHLVYCSNRGGTYQLYAVELRTGETRQLTRCRRLSNLSFSIDPGGRDVIYLDGSELWKTAVATGAGALIADLAALAPQAANFSAGRTFSRDGRYTPVGYSMGGAAVIALLNLETAKIEKTAEVKGGTGGHMLMCPADPHLVTFVRSPDEQNNMELPMERRARTMIADLRTGAVHPFLTMPYGWRATHEYWDSAGERFYFHRKKVPGWVPAGICSMKRDGSDWRTHFTSETLMLGHSMISHDGRFIVSDVQKPDDNPLVFIDLASGRHEILCWPDSSVREGHAKQAHVHPSISRSGRYVAYTSDRTGTAQVYVVPL
jgi:oligogalacturonide lyase